MRQLLFIPVLLIMHAVLPQNLVKNPSFETYLDCPNTLGNFNDAVTYWSTPTTGSTDYFNTCSKVMSAPENFNGIQHPKFGNAYAGVYFFAPGDYREYIQGQLKRTLRKGNKYTLTFYVSLAEGSDFAVKHFGVVLSNKPLQVDTKKRLSRGRLFQIKGNRFQTFEVSHAKIEEDKSIWQKITLSFTAKGFEKHLILGNLRDNKNTIKAQTKRKESKKGAYYYVDMVTITPEHKELDLEPNVVRRIASDSLYVFKNIHFDFDEFNLTAQAKTELQNIKNHLENNEHLYLQVHGHTDNQGTSVYNKRLSEKRAAAIAQYFKDLGIVAERIHCFAHGSNKPIATNTTEEGRSKNRRVEFLISSKK